MLTDREREVLQFMAEGLTSAQIAKGLHLSVYTVRGYADSILAKLGARNAPHAVYLACQQGVIPQRFRVIAQPANVGISA